MSVLHQLAVFCFAVVTASSEEIVTPPTKWTMENYPNPQTQKALCGKDADSVKYLCDPNHLLSEKEALQLEVEIEKVMNTTGCPCAEKVCAESSSPGYRIGVALMQGMEMPDKQNKAFGSSMRENLSNARLFAHTFLKRWKLGRCTEDLLILYAQDNTVLYTATGEETSIPLTGERVADISMRVKKYFSPSGDKFTGLRELISEYKKVFIGNYTDMEFKTVSPKYEAVIGGSDRLVTFTLATLTLTLLAALI